MKKKLSKILESKQLITEAATPIDEFNNLIKSKENELNYFKIISEIFNNINKHLSKQLSIIEKAVGKPQSIEFDIEWNDNDPNPIVVLKFDDVDPSKFDEKLFSDEIRVKVLGNDLIIDQWFDNNNLELVWNISDNQN